MFDIHVCLLNQNSVGLHNRLHFFNLPLELPKLIPSSVHHLLQVKPDRLLEPLVLAQNLLVPILLPLRPGDLSL